MVQDVIKLAWINYLQVFQEIDSLKNQMGYIIIKLWYEIRVCNENLAQKHVAAIGISCCRPLIAMITYRLRSVAEIYKYQWWILLED